MARTSVWLGPEGVQEPLDEFFRELAHDWRGWREPRSWEGMEGGLRLTCSHDGVGTVTIDVELNHHSGAGWSVLASVPLDPGQLHEIATNLQLLLTVQ